MYYKTHIYKCLEKHLEDIQIVNFIFGFMDSILEQDEGLKEIYDKVCSEVTNGNYVIKKQNETSQILN